MNALPVSRKQYWGIVAGIGFVMTPFILNAKDLPYMNKTPRPERTIVITGATGNLGRPTTKEIAKRQCRVIMACRDMDKCKALRREVVLLTKNHSIACRYVDLEDIDSINKFADELIEQEPHVDVLINMAGIKKLETRELTKYGIEKYFFVNFLAPYLLTLKLMPKLAEAAKVTRDSRVINVVGSPKKSWHIDLNDINFERRKYKPEAAYNQSKLAFAYFSILLEKFNREKRNQVYVFGSSPRQKNVMPAFDNGTGLWYSLKRFWSYLFNYSAENLCQRSVYCALDSSPVKDGQSGRNFNYLLSSWGWNHGWGIAAANEDKAKLVWNIAAEMLINAKPIGNKSDKSSKDGQGPENRGPVGQVKAQGNNKASGVLESV